MYGVPMRVHGAETLEGKRLDAWPTNGEGWCSSFLGCFMNLLLMLPWCRGARNDSYLYYMCGPMLCQSPSAVQILVQVRACSSSWNAANDVPMNLLFPSTLALQINRGSLILLLPQELTDVFPKLARGEVDVRSSKRSREHAHTSPGCLQVALL